MRFALDCSWDFVEVGRDRIDSGDSGVVGFPEHFLGRFCGVVFYLGGYGVPLFFLFFRCYWGLKSSDPEV